MSAYGIVLWLISFFLAFALFGVRESNRPLFESLVTVIGVACAVIASSLFFRNAKEAGLVPGLVVGFAWSAVSALIDLPIFLGVFNMTLPAYAADIALTCLAFPMIAAGIATAKCSAQAPR